MGELIQSGQSIRSAASVLGVSSTSVYRWIIRTGDQYDRRRRRPVTHEDRHAIIALARQGEVSVQRIAVQVGRSWHTVRRVVESANLPRLVPSHRCPHCGYFVRIQPCIICQAKEEAVNAHKSQANAEAIEAKAKGISVQQGLRPPMAAGKQAVPDTASALRRMPEAREAETGDAGRPCDTASGQ